MVALSLFVIAAVFAGTAFAIETRPCVDGTAYGKCSTANPGQYCTGSLTSPTLGPLISVCPCSNFPGYVQEGSGETATCIAAKCGNIDRNTCDSANKPKFCSNGQFISNATRCGCPTGKQVAADKLNCEFIPCNDGGSNVPSGTCSVKKQKKCVDGVLVDKASECGCPVGKTKVGEICTVLCPDGTQDAACSATKPKECVNGYLLDNAAKCGCPEGKTAAGKYCADSIFGGLGGAPVLGGDPASNDTGEPAAGGASALSCCCLPTALIGIVGGFAFFRKKK